MTNTLFQAVKDCRYLQAKFLIDSGVGIDSRNKHGENLLIAAITGIQDNRKRLQMVKWLLRSGIDIAEQDKISGRDCLIWAAVYDRTEEVKYILEEKEVDINLRNVDKYGRCPLHYAAINKNETMLVLFVRMFKKYRINVDVKDASNITPYIIANKLGHFSCASILLHEGGASRTQMIECLFDSSRMYDGITHMVPKPTRALSSFPRISTNSKRSFPKVPSIVFSDYGDNYRSEPKLSFLKQKSMLTDTQIASKRKNTQGNFEIVYAKPFTNRTQTYYNDRQDKAKGYQFTVMPAVFHLLSQQKSENYLPPVKKPEPPKPAKSNRMTFATLGKVTTFAVLLKNRALYTPMESDEVGV